MELRRSLECIFCVCVCVVMTTWLGEVIKSFTGVQILNLSVRRGPILDNFLHNSSIYEAKGVQIEAPKYAFRKVLKKR